MDISSDGPYRIIFKTDPSIESEAILLDNFSHIRRLEFCVPVPLKILNGCITVDVFVVCNSVKRHIAPFTYVYQKQGEEIFRSCFTKFTTLNSNHSNIEIESKNINNSKRDSQKRTQYSIYSQFVPSILSSFTGKYIEAENTIPETLISTNSKTIQKNFEKIQPIQKKELYLGKTENLNNSTKKFKNELHTDCGKSK